MSHLMSHADTHAQDASDALPPMAIGATPLPAHDALAALVNGKADIVTPTAAAVWAAHLTRHRACTPAAVPPWKRSR